MTSIIAKPDSPLRGRADRTRILVSHPRLPLVDVSPLLRVVT
jgi:hypothetical protein